MNHWSRLKEQGAGYWRLKFLLKIYQVFGKKIVQLFLYPIVLMIFIFARQTRKSSYRYLDKIYKFKIAKDHNSSNNSCLKPNYILVFKHLMSFAQALLDRVDSWSGNISQTQLNIKNPEVLAEVFLDMDQNKGPFFVCSHLGNIEVLRALSNFQNDQKFAINSLVQFSHTPGFNNLLKNINPNVSTNLISASDVGIDTVINIKEKLQKGEVIVAAGDRTAANNQNKTVAVNFLGQQANFPVGTFTLASLMESKIYFAFCLKSENGDSYDFYLYKAQTNFTSRANRKENLKKIVAEYAGRLEELCLEYPEQWYNFFDFWK
jgi:predicted LPLAT superfamily acyltransferase